MVNRWWDFPRKPLGAAFHTFLLNQFTLWIFSDVIGLEVFARVKNTQMPLRATSVPSVTKILAFLLQITEEDTAAKDTKKNWSYRMDCFGSSVTVVGI